MEFFENVAKIFSSFNVIDALVIILFALMFYYVFRILKLSNVRVVIAVFVLLVLATGAVFIFTDSLNGEAYMVVPIVLSGVVLVIFNVEVKRDILNIHSFNVLSEMSSHQASATKDEVERYVADIIKALQNLSKDNIGALIILANDNIPSQILESGVILDANISSQLIEGIFFPKAPLHDGAMIIRGHKIQAAGCFLPLTQKTSYPKDFGTRHRAGIGITEVANVVSLVVSEETGIISVIKQGNVQRYADYDLLKSALRDYYWQELPLSDKKNK